MDKKKYIRELFEVVDTHSILILNKDNQLIRLNVPFTVLVVVDLPGLRIGDLGSHLKNRKKLPPSALRILDHIDNKGPSTSEEIITATDMSKRTLRYALRILLSEEILKREPILYDMRKVRYLL